MKTIRRALAGALCLLVLLTMTVPAAAASTPDTSLTILFTHDTHDHFYPDANGRGGYTRLATLLNQQRAEADGPVVTLDAGDFSMGSLFQTIYATDAPELIALGAMGYDVTTLGNHEFDYRQQGLTDMLNAAKASGEPLPAIVQANYTTPEDPEQGAALTEALKNYPVTDYTVLEREGLRIAVFGVLGVDADDCAPMSGMAFEPVADAAQRVVAEIQEKEDPDFIICLSHSGTDENGGGEDVELAKAVDGIDVIISGHTHSVTPTPIRVNDTFIVSAGEYTQNLGRLTVARTEGGDTINAWDYQLIPVNDDISADPAMTALAEKLQAGVNEGYLADYGLDYDQVLTTSNADFTIEETGNLIGDAYIAAVRELEGDGYVPVDFAVAPEGVIRDAFRAGPVTTAQAFDVLSLGSGADGTPTYPLVSVYLTGRDLKNAFEVDASIAAALMPAAALYGAGMHWTYNPNRMILDKVTDSVQLLENGDTMPIDDDRLYRVIADLYSGQMLGAVESQSFGLLSVTPRDENGEVVTDLESRILKTEDGTELKAWYALASYLDAQDTITPPSVRKTAHPSWNPIDLLGNPGVPTMLVFAIFLLLVLLVIVIVRAIARRRRRKAHKPR